MEENKDMVEVMQKAEKDLQEIAVALKKLTGSIDQHDGVLCIKGVVTVD